MDEDQPRAAPWPLEIRYTAATRSLVIAYDDGVTFTYPAELLRVESPSAEVKGHGTDEKRIVAGRSHVGIMKIEPVGNYAVRLHFDDLHDTGLYSWRYLYELGERQDEIWQTYLAELDARGLSREP
ncbi:MAG: gamma-butyrobetaine hydroxylase-like domain-containing protein [Alphaproteobacteria bacterium]